MTHSCVEVYLHVIFATKNKQPLIPSDIEKRLYAYIGGIANKRKCIILSINGTEDHLHMLVNLHQDAPISTLLKEMKSYSTGWMKKQNYSQFSWQQGYGGFSYSKSQLQTVSRYIEKQKEHHKKYTFDDELKKLKNLWGVDWQTD